MTVDIAQLGLSVRSDGVVVATDRLEELEKQSKKTETAAERLQRQADKVSKSMGNIGRSMQSIGSRMTLFFTTPLVAAGFAAVRLAVDAEETANKFDVVFRGSVERAEAALKELTNTVPLTLSEMKALSAQMQDMLVPMGLVRSEAADLSVEAVKLAGDIASFNNVPVAEVLQNIGSALAGQSEPLRKYGIDVRKTRLETIALQHGLIGVGEELDNATTAQATFLAITLDSADAMGDAARTAESTANQARFLARDYKQLQEDIGRDLIPVYTELLKLLREGLDWFKELSPAQRENAIQIAAITAAAGPLVFALGSLVRVLGLLLPLLVRMGVLLSPASAVALGLAVIVKLIGEAYVDAIEEGITSTTRFIGSLRELADAADMAGLKTNLQSVNETIVNNVRRQAELQKKITDITSSRNDTDMIEIPGLKQMQEDLDQLERELGHLKQLRAAIEGEIDKLTKARVNPEVLRELKESFDFIDNLGKVGDGIDEEEFQKLLDYLDPSAKAMRELAEARAMLNAARGRLGEEEFQKLAAALERSDKAFKAYANRIGKQRAVNPQVLADFEHWSEVLDEIGKEQEEFNERLQDLRDIGNPVGALVRQLTLQMEDLDRAVRDGTISERERQTILNVLTDQLGKAAAATQNLTETTDVWKEAALEAVRILERAFTQAWSNIRGGFRNLLDGLLDGFETQLSSILHLLFTSPVTKSLSDFFEKGTKFDWSTLGTAAGGLAGFGLGSLLGGGGEFASIGSAIGTAFGSAALSALFPSLFTALGSFGGPLGAIIGGALGGLFGGLFDDDPDFEIQLVGAGLIGDPALQGRTGPHIGSRLGGFNVTNTGDFDQDTIEQFLQGMVNFDNTLAEVMNADQLGRVTEILQQWGIELDGAEATLDNLMQSRLDQIQYALSEASRAWVDEAKDLQEEIMRTGIAFRTETLFAEQPELFDGRTEKEFLAVVEAFADGTKTIVEAFDEVVAVLAIVEAATSSIRQFADADFIADYERLVMLQNETPVDTLTRLSSELFDAVATFDNTPEQLVDIANAFGTVREAGISAIAHIDAAWRGLTATIDQLRQDTLDIIAGPKSEREIFVEAAGLVDLAAQAQTPEELTRLGSQFDSLIRQLSPETVQRLGGNLIDLIDRFQAASDSSFERVRDQTLDAIASMQTMADAFLTRIPDALLLVASTNERAAAALEAIAGTADVVPQGVGVGQPVDVTAIATVLNDSASNQQQILLDGTNMMTSALRSGTTELKNNITTAIQSGFSNARITVNVHLTDSGLTNQ